MKILSVQAKEILDSAGNPTVKAIVRSATGAFGVGQVPAGASKSRKEAFELRDGDFNRFHGLGVSKAIQLIQDEISQAIIQKEFASQAEFDQTLIDLDGIEDKSRLGANSILSLSIAFARCLAASKNQELFQSLTGESNWPKIFSQNLPKPMMVIIEGGKHSFQSTDFQEYLLKPDGINSVQNQIRACQEVRIKLAELLQSQNISTNVGLEGAFAPNNFLSNHKPLEFITAAIKLSGYSTSDITIGLDVAADSFWQDNQYQLKIAKKNFSSTEMIEYLTDLILKFPITSIEDGLAEGDSLNWPILNQKLENCSLIGDDLTVTNPEKIRKFAFNQSIKGVIIKMNQIGTISETIEALKTAKENNLLTIVSQRAAETIDATLVDLAVATGADYIKVGPTRGERVEKYNRLMEIADLI